MINQINFCANTGLPQNVVPSMKEILQKTKNVKPFPELCKRTCSAEIARDQYFSPYTITTFENGSSKRLTTQKINEISETPPLPYN